MARFIRLPGLGRQRPNPAAADVDAEITSHLERTMELLIREGWSADAARAEALRRFGDLTRARRAMYASALRQYGRGRRRYWLESLLGDARYGVRQLARARGLALAVIGILALGVGANAAMFGVLDRLLLRAPAHVRDPGRVARVYLHREDRGREITVSIVSYLRLEQLREGAANALDLAGIYQGRVVVGRGLEAQQVRGGLVTANFWNLFGVRPLLGRFFDAADDGIPDGAAVAVLGHDHWRAAYGADSTVIGRPVTIGAREFTVIGVAPAGFTGPGVARVDVWLPATSSRAIFPKGDATWQDDHSFSWLTLVGRLRAGASSERAEALLTSAYRSSLEAESGKPDASARASVWPLLLERGPERSDATRVALWLGAVAVVVLLLSCANVANLLLARALQRRGELAIRLALGITRARLVRQLLVESAILVGLGALAGIAMALFTGSTFHAILFPGLDIDAPTFDHRMLVFALAATALATLLSGLGPALYASRYDLRDSLSSSTRITTHRSRLRMGLLAGQAALSTLLLVGAGLFVQSLRSAASTDLGFDADHLLVVRVDVRSAIPVPGRRVAIYRQFAERLRELRGVRGATTTTQIPFGISAGGEIDVPGVDSAARLGEFLANAVGEDYFETSGTRILEGRAFVRDDFRGSRLVMVVSDAMARLLWPGQTALGKCVRDRGPGSPCSEVVGVAANVHQRDVRAEPSLQYWLPEAEQPSETEGPYAVLVRVDGDPVRFVAAIRQAVQPLAPTTAYISVLPVADSVRDVIRPWRLGAVMFCVFGGLGLLIAAVGLYSVLAYSVDQRRREFGVRTALGARRDHVLRMVLVQGILITTMGVALGLLVAVAASGRLAPLLLGVGPRDPVVISVVVVTLLVVSMLASIVPAWRATRVDPALVLRE